VGQSDGPSRRSANEQIRQYRNLENNLNILSTSQEVANFLINLWTKYWWGQLHRGPPNQIYGWATVHLAHPTAPLANCIATKW